MRRRVAQELGRSRCLHACGAAEGSPPKKSPARGLKRPEAQKERTTMDAGRKWYRRVKETKRGEKGSEKS